MNHTLKGRALITGGSSGIGAETALAFAKAGWDVAVVSRSQQNLDAIVSKLQEFGVHAQGFACDLAQVEQVKATVAQVLGVFGPVDVLVNNAGMCYTGTVAETPLADWQRVIDLNLTSVFQCIQAILPSMRDRKHGLIINVSSIAGHQAFPQWGAYSVSKAGLISLSRILAVEERQHGIRVVTITPGSVNTPLWDSDTVQADFDRSGMLTPSMVAESILHMALLPPQAVIEDLVIMPSGGAL